MDSVNPVAANGVQKKLQLYSFWYSSCSERVRIVLNLKKLEYEYRAVNLTTEEHFKEEFVKLNPAKSVPVLVDNGFVIADSLAIILYLDEKYPQHPLLPGDLQRKILNIQIASTVCSSIHPLQNVAIVSIKKKLNVDESFLRGQDAVTKGFTALEKLLERCAGKYATGDEIFLADVFLYPQINAGITRFKIDLTAFPILFRLKEAYNKLPDFYNARPEMQPDAMICRNE